MSDRLSPQPSSHASVRPRPPRVIGITGGIGMGKTTISNYLSTVHHLPVLDADVYARQAVERNSPVFTEIVERYGSTILLPDGQLDRVRLGDIVFHNSAERLWLEQRIHPFVRDCISSELQSLAERQVPTAVTVVPLLFEARMTDLTTEIWVVHCTRNQQVERVIQRDASPGTNGKLKPEQVYARIDSQMPIEAKLERADIILDNSGTLETLFQQIDQALQSNPHASHRH
ncbi:MAG TPA: dephospho-CoA kinase [Synechococcales cyanobacterium M55_K2018_004]|nr:dephospho-CoA kinase [Synechococcales cyanobacterium M55_K2018_004]